jgi:hypothetical protein
MYLSSLRLSDSGKLKLPSAHPSNDSEIVLGCRDAHFPRSQALESLQLGGMIHLHRVRETDAAVDSIEKGVKISGGERLVHQGRL